MPSYARRSPFCAECGACLNAGFTCEICGVIPVQIDLDCQMAIEEQPGASRFVRPVKINPSKRWSDRK